MQNLKNTCQLTRVITTSKVPISPPKMLQPPTPHELQTPPPITQTPHLIPSEPEDKAPQQNPRQNCDSPPTTPRRHKYNTRLNVAKQSVNSLVEKELGKSLEYWQLIQHPKHKHVWSKSMSNEIGRLTQGNDRVSGTNNIIFIAYDNIPHNR